MKGRVETSTVIIVTFNEEEVEWLTGLLRNPVHGAETLHAKQMRDDLVHELNPKKPIPR